MEYIKRNRSVAEDRKADVDRERIAQLSSATSDLADTVLELCDVIEGGEE